MEMAFVKYQNLEEKVLENLKINGIKHRIHIYLHISRSKGSSGLWIGGLIGFCGVLTLLKESNSYSEICLVTGLGGFGLLVSCLSLYVRLFMGNGAIKDFHAIYFLPSITTSMLYLLVANKAIKYIHHIFLDNYTSAGLLTSLIWGLSVGSLGTWGVLQLMSHCPGCFTIGEATIVMHGIILFLLSVATNVPLRYHLPPIHNDDIVTVILQIGILYVLSVCILCKSFPILRSPLYFYTMLFGTFFLLAVPFLYVLLDKNPITWILIYITGESHRIKLIIYWTICLLFCTFVIIFQTVSGIQATTSVRKYFHVLAVLVYIPGLIFEATLLYLGSGVILGIFILFELSRILHVSPLGDILQKGFIVFVDEKDTLISLTPLYLLCGLSFPLWMPASNVSLFVLLSGVLTVGIGDTAASFVGSKWGKHKWPGLEKSLEGTLGCVISQLGTIMVLAYMRICVKVKGEANTYWTTDKQRLDNTGNYRDENTTFNAHEEYFQTKYYLVGSASGNEIEIQAGEHKFPFTCTLPENLPSSFESDFGHVRYTVKAILDRPWKFDQEVKAAFTIVLPFDLNQEPRTSERIREEMSKSFCCLCCTSAPLNVTYSLPVRGYVPGQSMPIKINVENLSNVTVARVTLSLCKFRS
ncbi:dolichol kinase isoform X5 [Vespa velutina]|uniref:dolichol kinase isoform X5 n=1 Tax=Vespa velutina TaxID=202808 RepID=UPI001FB28552|nr:dolichol kinase isoform X5 [Vespa velutina]